MTDLFSYVKATEGDRPYVEDCDDQAKAMVQQYIEDNIRRGVAMPEPVRVRAELEVGADLFYRRQARNGIAGLDGGADGGMPLRIARDPMRAAYDVLAPYMKPALA